MNVTVGKLVWVFSFVIFLIIAYNMNTFERLWNVVFDESLIITISEFKQTTKSAVTEERVVASPRRSTLADSITTNLNDVLSSVGGLIVAGETVELGTESIINTDLHLKVERLTWELEQINEQLLDLKVQITELTTDKDITIGNLVAIFGALTPLLLPLITSRFKSHNKQIMLGKK